MKPYKDICKDCNQEKWISNARGLCNECVFKANHDGKSRFEVAKEKEVSKPRKIYNLKRTPLKSKKNIQKLEEKIERRKQALEKDHETYLQVFNKSKHKCEECGCNLPNVFKDDNGNLVAIYRYSHILSKGSHNEYRYELWNFNELCFKHHSQWDHGDRKSMKIYERNKQIVFENTGFDIL